jgi:hypothetical protein
MEPAGAGGEVSAFGPPRNLQPHYNSAEGRDAKE